jgi:hypothetical protein
MAGYLFVSAAGQPENPADDDAECTVGVPDSATAVRPALPGAGMFHQPIDTDQIFFQGTARVAYCMCDVECVPVSDMHVCLELTHSVVLQSFPLSAKIFPDAWTDSKTRPHSHNVCVCSLSLILYYGLLFRKNCVIVFDNCTKYRRCPRAVNGRLNPA